MARIRADLWCTAFVRRHNDIGNMCVIARKGDPSAGQIWIDVDHLDGTKSLFTPAPSIEGQYASSRLFQCLYEAVAPQKIQERIAREIEFDPDLWVIALDLRGGDHGLDMSSVA